MMHILPSLHMVIGFPDHIYVFNPLRPKSPEGMRAHNQQYLLLTTESGENQCHFTLRYMSREINNYITLF